MGAGQSAPGGLTLRGRRDERAVLDRLLANARSGRSGVLVLEGEAGVGKTALLDYAVASASDFRVLRAVAVESEMELAFAALHQLCGPVLDRLERLPVPQSKALLTTFGLRAGLVPDRFLVGLAVLTLLSEVADERPLVCVVDDAQWLDRASAQCVAFVARRLLAESVVMLFAAREQSDLFAGLPKLVVEGLRGADARSLLVSVIPGRLDEGVAHELLAETRGNPLALLELPRGLTAAQLAGGFGLPGALSLSGRIEQSYRGRLEALSERSQQLLLVAAAEPVGDQNLLWRAAERLGITDAALEPAEAAGLIEIDDRVRFRHPLVRSAIYRWATAEQRRRVHWALAEATDAQVDPDRRAWHLAEAAGAPDEGVATELERGAGRAQARGGLAAAAAFLERASGLTPEPARRAQRALAAAQTKFEAGALDDALAVLAKADVGQLDALQRARVNLLRGQIAFAARRGRDAPPLLLSAARELESLDPKLARATYLDALTAALFAGRFVRGGSALEVSQAVLGGPGSPQPPDAADLLLDGLALLITDGPSIATPVLKRAVSAFRAKEIPEESVRWLWLAGQLAGFIWDYEGWDDLTGRQIQAARDEGALATLALALNARAPIQILTGELQAGAALVEEADALSEVTGRAMSYAGLPLDAFRGREDEATPRIETGLSGLSARGRGLGLAHTHWASAVLYSGLGRYEDARAAAEHALEEDPHELWYSTWAAVELIEAASRTGNAGQALGALKRLTATARAGGSDWGLGVEARSRALLSDGDAAESLYREAIERLQRTRLRIDVARGHLLYGEWLRRERRRRDAREQLRAALEMFTSMGTEAFAGRAERELSATGEHVRRRSVETLDELTTQEAQIARLARDGLSNRDIGDRLFISQHTVAYHLRKVFSKLGITSRNQLARALPESGRAGQVA
ncbi:MAG TPA: AAA family ATPase [Solirubrobacteraceae bacterium]|nr:AAA family ATPase [Solirubrobacteraceae bacterium]